MAAHQLLAEAVDMVVRSYEFVHASWRRMAVFAEELTKKLFQKALYLPTYADAESFGYAAEDRRLKPSKANPNLSHI
jgi:hypothetical protein